MLCREPRGGRSALFDGIEEGGIRAASSSSYTSHEINEHENERALEGLQDRVILLKRVSLIDSSANVQNFCCCCVNETCEHKISLQPQSFGTEKICRWNKA